MRINFIINIVLLASSFADAQSFSDFFSDSIRYVAQVKQLDEFVVRFNNVQNLATGELKSKKQFQEEVSDTAKYHLKRKSMIGSLFNADDSTLIHNPSSIEFINEVVRKNYYLHTDKGHIYALVACIFTLKKTEQKINISLERVGNDTIGYKWIIIGTDFNTKENILEYIQSLHTVR